MLRSSGGKLWKGNGVRLGLGLRKVRGVEGELVEGVIEGLVISIPSGDLKEVLEVSLGDVEERAVFDTFRLNLLEVAALSRLSALRPRGVVLLALSSGRGRRSSMREDI